MVLVASPSSINLGKVPMFGKRFLRLAAVSAAVALPLGMVAASPASAAKAPKPTKATVTVLHAIPASVLGGDGAVEVCVNDAAPPAIASLLPGNAVETELVEGTYALSIRLPGKNCTGDPILTATATVKKGKNYTITANLTATGTPTISVFRNNLSKLPKRKGRLTVRHIAAAPAVDVFIAGNVVMPNLQNGQQQQRVVRMGTYPAAAGLSGAGTAGIALGPVPVEVKAGTNTIVYAWGAPGAFDVWSQDIAVGLKKKKK